jgi:hypothetical protein
MDEVSLDILSPRHFLVGLISNGKQVDLAVLVATRVLVSSTSGSDLEWSSAVIGDK